MELENLERDIDSIEEGRWIKDLPGAGDLELKVRGLTADSVIAYRASRERAVGRQDRHQDGTLKMAASYRVLCETLAEKVLLDWKGLTEKGKEIKYSKEVARKLMLNPKMRAFHDAVTQAAQIVDNGYDEAKEDAAKN